MINTEVVKQESLPTIDVGSKNKVDPNEKTLYELGVKLQDRYNQLKQFRLGSTWESDKVDAYNDYHMVPKNRPLPYPGAANLSCPFPRIGVDSFHANVMSSLFSEGNRMKLAPIIIQKDFASTADKAVKYMNFAVNQESNIYIAMDDADRKAQIYGMGYLEPVYQKEDIWETVDVTETQESVVQDELTGEVKVETKEVQKRVKKRKTVFDGVRVNSLPFESVLLSPFVQSMEEAVKNDAVFKTFTCSYSSIKEKSKAYKDLPPIYKKTQVEKLFPYVRNKVLKDLSEIEQARSANDGFYIDQLCDKEQLELAEAHLWFDIDNDDIREEITVTFHPESAIILRVTLSKCRIVEIVPRPLDGRFDGEGIPKVIKRICEEWEMFHNTRANAGQWENTPFGFYRAGGRLNMSKITVQPGMFYPVDDPREVNFAQTPRVGASYFQEEQLLLSYFERILALDENFQGISSRRSRTATETINVSNRSSVRFSNPFNRIVIQMNKILDHIWELSKECAPEKKEFYVLGETGNLMFDQMKKYDYSANLKFAVVVSSVYDQQLVRDTNLLAYRLFLVNPLVQQHPEIMYELSQRTLDSLQIKIELPKPPEAKTLSPFEEHEMFQRGDEPEPQVGEDYDHHLAVHMQMLKNEDINQWDVEAVGKLVVHIDKTKILKQTLESANLNTSGRFTGNPIPNQPGMTSNRNPTQMFNTMKVGESGKSMRRNVSNGANNTGGANSGMDQKLDSIMGGSV